MKHVPAFCAEISVMAVLEALGDAPRAYTMGQGGNAGHSHRRVAWLGDGIDTPCVTAMASAQLEARSLLRFGLHRTIRAPPPDSRAADH